MVSRTPNSNFRGPVKYFSTQAFISLIIIITVANIDAWGPILFTRLLAKLGLPPFHSWIVSVVYFCETKSLLILITSQKIIPLSLLPYLSLSHYRVFTIIVLVLICTLIFIVGQYRFIIVILSSSMIRTSWVVPTIFIKPNLGIRFFITYSVFAVLLLSRIRTFNSRISLSINSFTRGEVWQQVMFFIVGGIPPRPVFLFKIRVVLLLLNERFTLLALTVILFNALRFVVYLRGLKYVSTSSSSLVSTYSATPYMKIIVTIFIVLVVDFIIWWDSLKLIKLRFCTSIMLPGLTYKQS